MPNTALIVIDVQRGAFDGIRCSPIDQLEALLHSIRNLLSAGRRSGTPIVFIQHCGTQGQPFEEGSPHWNLHEDLAPRAGETLLRKYESCAFEGTELTRLLEAMDARNLVMCGLQSELCVSNTAKGALARGFSVTVARDGHSTWPCGDETPDAIKERVNAELAAAGAQVQPVAGLVCSIKFGH